MDGCVAIPFNSEYLKTIVDQAKDYLLSHGLVLRTVQSPHDRDTVTHAPVTLLPSPVPCHLYEQALNVQNDINLLMHNIAHDHDFLKQCLEEVIKVDDFTQHLWDIYDTVTKEGISQPYSLGLNRSDYMFDCGNPTTGTETVTSGAKVDLEKIRLRMIEMNTMASSFGGLSQQLEGFHRFILDRVNLHEETIKIPPRPKDGARALNVLAKGMVTAWECYGNTSAAVLFLVLDVERNVYDQRHLEYAVYNINSSVKVIYRTLKDIKDRSCLTSEKNLVVDGIEVAVVYQRSLYTPDHYPTEQDWMTRLLLERSRAIKCPSAGYHLAGTKKVQQVLANPGVVERLISDPVAVRHIRDTFAGQYSLDLNEDGDKAVAMALENPHLYVLKPQREGGGNNTFGEDIRLKLSEIRMSAERTAYILMDHIHPYQLQNYMLRSGEPVDLYTCVCELGIYGAFVGTQDKVMLNLTGGNCLRTKAVGTNEGGVASGYSCLDSPFLI